MHEDQSSVCSKCHLMLGFSNKEMVRRLQDNVYFSIDEIVAQVSHSVFRGHVVVPRLQILELTEFLNPFTQVWK